jgi:hypothetical protein
MNRVKEINVAAVEGNSALAIGVDRRAIDRCRDAIDRLGVLHTPVVGSIQGGRRVILSGQCELTAMRELGVLPIEAQFEFAENSVKEGLPKSAIEALVSGYNDESCPDAVKSQIRSDPRAALKRMADKGRATAAEHPGTIGAQIRALNLQMALLCKLLHDKPPYEINGIRSALKDLENELAAMLAFVRKIVSPGKTEVRQDAG